MQKSYEMYFFYKDSNHKWKTKQFKHQKAQKFVCRKGSDDNVMMMIRISKWNNVSLVEINFVVLKNMVLLLLRRRPPESDSDSSNLWMLNWSYCVEI